MFQCLFSLEMALSRDFTVQNSPLYQLILGRAHRDMGDVAKAQDCLLRALTLSKARAVAGRLLAGAGGTGQRSLAAAEGPGEGPLTGEVDEEGLSRSEVAIVHLELVSILTKLGRQVSEICLSADAGSSVSCYSDCLLQHEAAKVMQDAINEFTGTPEEYRYMYTPPYSHTLYTITVHTHTHTHTHTHSGLTIHTPSHTCTYILQNYHSQC